MKNCNANSSASRLFALVIGINDYEHATPSYLCKLSGAVSDADDVVKFLKAPSMSVPDSRIRNLRDRQATRANIIESICALSTCEDIEENDPILIFYAGHGGVATSPPGWSSSNGKIQMLLPCDFLPRTTNTEIGQGIPDITFSILLNNLAQEKGNNIVCHD